jgi:uncharacterized repeat protein (TIGR01451 family)
MLECRLSLAILSNSIAFLIMKKLLVTTSVVLFGLFAAGTSYASYGSVNCTPIYGGGTSCESSNKFVLDKKVLNPDSVSKGGNEQYVDNLTINNSKFAPGQTIKFELTVTNTGDKTLNELVLKDILPSYITFVSGPGSYDKNSNTLSFNILNLNAGESRKFILVTKANSADQLPNGQGVVCVVNQASVVVGNDESRDNSQFCIEKTVTKGGLPVMPAPKMTQTPSTGAESLALFGLIPAALSGVFLRRRSK